MIEVVLVRKDLACVCFVDGFPARGLADASFCTKWNHSVREEEGWEEKGQRWDVVVVGPACLRLGLYFTLYDKVCVQEKGSEIYLHGLVEQQEVPV